MRTDLGSNNEGLVTLSTKWEITVVLVSLVINEWTFLHIPLGHLDVFLFFFIFYFFLISWRLITLQYCSGFCQMSSLKKCLVNSNYLDYFSIGVFVFLLLSFKCSSCVCAGTHTCVLSRFSGVQLYATLWTVAHQFPLCMGIVWARIVEWVSMPSSRGSHRPRDWTHGSYVSCIGGWVLYH